MNNLDKPLIVQKYGGSSLATPEQIKNIAANIVARKDQGVNLIIVVSAMGKTTDEFIRLAHQVNSNPSPREMDMLLSVGERVSISLVTMAINAIGKYSAISYTGSQVGIVTDDNHTDARILEVKGHRIIEALAEDKIVVVAGFQGVSIHKEITTLGRGGSDTTAVALAAALNAEACEIMSDVDGIYSADPRFIPAAKRIERMHFDEALQMAAAGAKMLHRKSVEYAKSHTVKLSLGSSFTGYIGTIVTDESFSKNSVTAVVHDTDVVPLTISQCDPVVLSEWLSNRGIRPKFWQAVDGKVNFSLSVAAVERHYDDLRAEFRISFEDKRAATVSVIGPGVAIGSQVANSVSQIIKEKNWTCLGVENSELCLKFLVPQMDVDVWVTLLHNQLIES